MTPDVLDALTPGDGRLTRVFSTAGLAFLRRPFALMGIGSISFLPLLLYAVSPAIFPERFHSWGAQVPATLASLMPPPRTFFVAALFSFCFALCSGPLCWISYRAIYPDKKIISFARSFRSLLPMLGIWLLIFFVMLIWFALADLMYNTIGVDTEFLPYLWFGVLLALLASAPAFLSLCAPVFTLEGGSVRTRWRRATTLGNGYRWRSIGYTMGCAVPAFLVAVWLSTAILAVLPFRIRQLLDDWIYLSHFGFFWMIMCLLVTSLYARIRLARGELDPEDVAYVFE
jgi:hypothetical protein